MQLKNILPAIICLFFISCSELVVSPDSENYNKEDFESAWQQTKAIYPFFKFKQINWDSLHSVYSSAAVNAKGDEIYTVLCQLMAELKDGHVQVATKGGSPVPVYVWPRYADHKSFSQSVVSTYLGKPFRLAGQNNIAYERLNSIGYIYLSTFTEGDWISDFDGVLDYLKGTDALIIDLRNNSGGSSLTSDFMLSRLTDRAITEKMTYQDGHIYQWAVYPNGPFRYVKPVVILVNGASFSCSELFLESMRQRTGVTVVGDTTGGGGGASDFYALPSGKRIKIPKSYFTRATGQMIEWNGIIPDVIVHQTEADMRNGIDRQLEAAIAVAKGK